MNYKEKYNEWLNSKVISESVKEELRGITDEKELEDRFYKELDFGTGGLRGVIGYGSNRMNVYTVSKATQGFANYLNKNFESPKVAIAYDSRNMSKEFAEAAALTLCANNVKVYLYESLRPTPMLSFATRHLSCQGGIVITASHNPKIYNGYKVYDEFGGQVTDEKAGLIINEVNSIENYEDIKTISLEEAIKDNLLEYIGEDVDKAYLEEVKGLTIRTELVKEHAKDLKVIYTPIHGSGNMPVRRVLKELGYENVEVVKEQEKPDGNFPTASYPNPENPQVFELALEMAKTNTPDIIFGTDPDCDRIGVVVKENSGEYKVLTGNQTGLLLTDYILSSLKEEGKLPSNGVVIKTIVTSEGARAIANYYGVEIMDVLTGFKYIGEKIRQFQEKGDKKYLFGFEESYGYLVRPFVRDKDAVQSLVMLAEVAAFYKKQGKNLYDGLQELFEKHGYFVEKTTSLTFDGVEGANKIKDLMAKFRAEAPKQFGDYKVVAMEDFDKSEKSYADGKVEAMTLPKSNVLKFLLEDGTWIAIRPSGTEPKIKFYIGTLGDTLEAATKKRSVFEEEINNFVNE